MILPQVVNKNGYIKRHAIHDHKASKFLQLLSLQQSGLAQEILKNPYDFDFIALHKDTHEREIKFVLTQHITQFLTELGKGFAFVGKQAPIDVDNEEII